MSRPRDAGNVPARMVLEEGKFYRNRQGDIVEVRLAYPGEVFCFERINGDPLRYRANGKYADSDSEPTAVQDLIEEVDSAPWSAVFSRIKAPRNT